MEDPAEESRQRPRRSNQVRVGRTRVGKGIFARRHYRELTIIGEIQGELIEDLEYGSDYCFELGRHGLLEPDAPYRFVNHSCEPNCVFSWSEVADAGEKSRPRGFLVALCDIEPESELTIDYHWPAVAAIPCRCGAPSCRGWIVDSHELDEVT